MTIPLVFVVCSLLVIQGAAYAQSLCIPCHRAVQEEMKKCLDAAISREDKQWCVKKQDVRAEACENGECTLENAQRAAQGEPLTEQQSSLDRENETPSDLLMTR